jgi:putative peptidoglycan lipid II flippase
MVPRLLGVAVVELNFLVNIILASAMEEGSLTALALGRAVMMTPEIIIAQSIAIAALPTFSTQAASGRVDEMRASLANTLRGVVFLSLPASLGLILLRKTIVSLLFERGAFDASSTELVAWALLWYAAGLIGHSVLEIIVRAFYAMKDTRSPVIVGALAMSLNVVFSLIFSPWFARIGWAPYGGLALANSLATALECLILLSMIRRRLGGLDLRRLRRGLVASVVAATTMGVVLLVWLTISDGSPMWLIGGAGVAIGATVYWLAALALGAPEARQLPGILRRREM